MATIYERARLAARTGYTLSENVYCPGLFNVHRPDGVTYCVDAERSTCDCPSSVPCKHIGLVEISRRFWLALERKRRTPSRRRRFSRNHIAALRRFAPVMAGPSPEESRKAAFKARMDADFGPDYTGIN